MRFDNQIHQVTGRSLSAFQNMGPTWRDAIETVVNDTFDKNGMWARLNVA